MCVQGLQSKNFNCFCSLITGSRVLMLVLHQSCQPTQHLLSSWYVSIVQVSSAHDCIYVLGKTHMHSTWSLRWFSNVALVMVPIKNFLFKLKKKERKKIHCGYFIIILSLAKHKEQEQDWPWRNWTRWSDKKIHCGLFHNSDFSNLARRRTHTQTHTQRQKWVTKELNQTNW